MTQLSWNGRMSEIVAAVVRQQLIGFPRHLEELRDGASELERFLESIDGLSIVLGYGASVHNCSFTQLVFRLDENAFGWRRAPLVKELSRLGLQARAANFEPINTLSFFKGQAWAQWLPRADIARVRGNYEQEFVAAGRIYREVGFGLGNANLLSRENLSNLKRTLTALALRGK